MGSDEAAAPLLLAPEAALTTLLDLDESERRFIELQESFIRPTCHPKIDGLAVFAQETFRRYKQSNQRIDTFRLSLKTDWFGISGLAAKWTLRALKMGATDLTFRLNRSAYAAIFIPFDEVFATDHVLRLCLDRLKVYQRLEVIKCTRLQSLTLDNVLLSVDSFYNIVSSCPLIESLSLSDIDSYDIYYDENGCERRQKLGTIPHGSTISLHKLTSLVLSGFVECEIQNLFMGDSSSKFPNLKDLTLSLTFFGKGVEKKHVYFISIHSLEILNFSVYHCDYYDFVNGKKRMVEYSIEFDVPSIRKFTFEGSYIPNVSFRSTSTDQWEESRVQLSRNGELSALWFCELSNFLKEMRRSKIHLDLHLHGNESFDYQAGEIEGLDLVELEDLTMDTEGLPSMSFEAFLDGLFRICRPKMITQYKRDSLHDYRELVVYDSVSNSNDTFLCKALIGQEMQGKRLLIVSQFMLSLLDLEEVNAYKFFDEEGWIPQPLDSILDDSQKKFRFQLKWKPY